MVGLPVRAVSLDLTDMAQPSDAMDRLEQRMRDVGVTMVALSAGRLDWIGFRRSGQEERWSAGVRESGRDLLMDGAQRFGRWAHVSAVVDVFAPRYLQKRPSLRALDAAGRPIPYQASTNALVNGPFGDELILMIAHIARSYPIDSITLTDLFYYQEGYGADDLALYREYSKRRDWPRTADSSIDVDHPTIAAWRSVIVARFVERAARVAHAHGKQLFVDVRVGWDSPADEGRRSGHDYRLLLQHADRLVLWNYIGLHRAASEYTGSVAQYVQRYGADSDHDLIWVVDES
ncbi:MAG: family 10 glycosylhydrolase [Roseiflexus sp.]